MTTISYSLNLYGKPEILYATIGNIDPEQEDLINSFRTVVEKFNGSFRKVDNVAQGEVFFYSYLVLGKLQTGPNPGFF